ncbi:MAG: hypothetical protein IJ600_04610 [Lachnospiraceae bacterium]|nr:hypothetical protein [Lachnospiraceae bacterium]
MQTDKIMVYSNGTGIENALKETERFAKYQDLDRKSAMRLRLLAEETLGMVKAITGAFNAKFWLEKDGDTCKIHLDADTYMDDDKKRELISISSSGKNEANKGFMGMVKNLFLAAMKGFEDANQAQIDFGDSTVMFGTLGMREVDAITNINYVWSYAQFKENVVENDAENGSWDELEKSIVGNIADDVRVAVKGDIVELVIMKKF